MLRIIALPLVLVTPVYADVFSCVQHDGRTVLQFKPCKKHHVARPPTPSDSQAGAHRPEDMKFTNNKGQHCRFVPPSDVKLVCEEGIEQPHVDVPY